MTNLQFLSEFCHLSHFTLHFMTKVKFQFLCLSYESTYSNCVQCYFPPHSMAMMVFKAYKLADNGEENSSMMILCPIKTCLNCHLLHSFGSAFEKAVGTSSDLFGYLRKSSKNRRKFSKIPVMQDENLTHLVGRYMTVFLLFPVLSIHVLLIHIKNHNSPIMIFCPYFIKSCFNLKFMFYQSMFYLSSQCFTL